MADTPAGAKAKRRRGDWRHRENRASPKFVSKRVSEEDHRGRVIALTDAGKRVIDDAFTAHIANEHRLLEPLSAKERADLERLLTKWLSAYED